MQSFSITDIGQKRSVNQDYVYCHDDPIGNLSNLYLVADGMGGHKAGDLASHCAVDTMVEEVKQITLKTPVSILSEAIAKANQAVIEKASSSEDYEGMGTTLVAATVMNDMLYVANIGDSRLYLIRDGEITQITVDHSLVEAMVQTGSLLKEDARFHPHKNVITRAVGTNPFVEADYFEIHLKTDDVIVMCTDGLSNMLYDSEIKRAVSESGEDMEAAGRLLVKRANEEGGRDNIGVVLVRI
ncbi:MAG: Stp1/IreP family PP2C-type Ser/Thr phosphatase [Clostridiales bacterium]|nr:Stp1/IreP family PP2C-type Ser/Thr phosphatase [Clostridiales bacterium]